MQIGMQTGKAPREATPHDGTATTADRTHRARVNCYCRAATGTANEKFQCRICMTAFSLGMRAAVWLRIALAALCGAVLLTGTSAADGKGDPFSPSAQSGDSGDDDDDGQEESQLQFEGASLTGGLSEPAADSTQFLSTPHFDFLSSDSSPGLFGGFAASSSPRASAGAGARALLADGNLPAGLQLTFTALQAQLRRVRRLRLGRLREHFLIM
jgi:hypothetical protein